MEKLIVPAMCFVAGIWFAIVWQDLQWEGFVTIFIVNPITLLINTVFALGVTLVPMLILLTIRGERRTW